jgi:hypothetical protein
MCYTLKDLPRMGASTRTVDKCVDTLLPCPSKAYIARMLYGLPNFWAWWPFRIAPQYMAPVWTLSNLNGVLASDRRTTCA